MKALILSAGLGTRLRPLTDRIPKPLVDINGTPVIDLIIDKLEKTGVKEFAFNLHHIPEPLKKHLTDRLGKRAFFTFEEELLDTGGSIASVAEWASDKKVLIVHNGDILSDIMPDGLVSALDSFDVAFALLKRGKSDNVRLDIASGRITDMRNITGAPEEGSGMFTFSGIAAYSSDFIARMPKGKYSVVEYLALGMKNGTVNPGGIVFNNAFWNDIGTFESLEECRREVKDGKYRLP